MRSIILLSWFIPLLLAAGLRAAADAPSGSPPELHVDLLQAIKERRVVVFNYDGRRRVVEPHAYGQSRKGHGLLRGYELPGSNDDPSTAPAGWTLYSVDKMTAVELSDRTFAEPRPGYRRGDRKMERIHAEL